MRLSIFKSAIFFAALMLLGSTCLANEPVVFSWGWPAQNPASQPPYQVLAQLKKHHAVAVPIQSLPKTGYAYGWFGSNAQPSAKNQWGRHLGYSKNFTQWTSR